MATPPGDLSIAPEFVFSGAWTWPCGQTFRARWTATNNQTLNIQDAKIDPRAIIASSPLSRGHTRSCRTRSFLQANWLGRTFLGHACLACTLMTQFLQVPASRLLICGLATSLRGTFPAPLFSYADASSSTFDGANLEGADAGFSTFEGASTIQVNLRNTDLSSAVLTGADCHIRLLEWLAIDSNTIIDPNPKLIWQVLNQGAGAGANLTNRDLSVGTLTNANFHGAKLNNANLFASDLRGADLGGANLSGASMNFVDLRAPPLMARRSWIRSSG